MTTSRPDLAHLDEPTDSESPDAPYNPDVFELRSRIQILQSELAAAAPKPPSSGMVPVVMGCDALAGVLGDMAARVLALDSFDGHLEYHPTTVHGQWEVAGAYRVGNREGQGGMRIIGTYTKGA